MRDLIHVVITLAFFGLCVGLVRGCDALIGPDGDELGDAVDSTESADGSTAESLAELTGSAR